MSIIVNLEITDPVLIAGVTYAMGLYNESLPEQVIDPSGATDTDGNPVMIANPARFADPADYVRWVGTQAVKSYARQKAQADFDEGLITKAQRDAALAALA